jgi:hypothetical protein
VVPRAQEPLLDTKKIRKLEDEFIPESLQPDYAKTFGRKKRRCESRNLKFSPESS